MKLIDKLVSITYLNPDGKKETSIVFLKMPDRNNGKDDLSLQKCDESVLRKNMAEGYTFIEAHIVCTEYSGGLIPEKYRF